MRHRDYVYFICQIDLAEILNKYELNELCNFKYLYMITSSSTSFIIDSKCVFRFSFSIEMGFCISLRPDLLPYSTEGK